MQANDDRDASAIFSCIVIGSTINGEKFDKISTDDKSLEFSPVPLRYIRKEARVERMFMQ